MRSQKRVLTIVDTPFFLRLLILALHLIGGLRSRLSLLKASISSERQSLIRNKDCGSGTSNFSLPLIQGARGFSLAEVLVTSAILGGLALVTMQMTKNQQDALRYTESKSEEMEMMNKIRLLLTDKDSCEQTFNGVNLGSSVTRIRNGSGDDIFVVSNTYGNNNLRLDRLVISNSSIPAAGGTGLANLTVRMERLRGERPGTNLISKSLGVQVTAASPTGAITSCYADNTSIIATSLQEACESIGGVFNSVSNICQLGCSGAGAASLDCITTTFEDQFVEKTGDTMSGDLAVNADLNVSGTSSLAAITGTSANLTDSLTANRVTSNTEICVGSRCRDFTSQACALGSVVTRVNEDGTVNCQALACPSNQFFAGLSIAGSPVCRPFPTNTCPTNQYVSEVRANGTVVCQQVPFHWAVTCTTGTVVQSVSAAGVPTCVNAGPANTACAWNQAVGGFNSSGTPICVPRGLWSKTADASNNAHYNGGNIGLGTTAPTSKIHIKQSSNAGDDGLTLENASGTGAMRLYFSSQTAFPSSQVGKIRLGSSDVLTMRSNGQVYVDRLNVSKHVHFDSETSWVCNSALEGGLRYNGVTKQMEFCNGSSWTSPGGDGGLDLVNGFHSSDQCTLIGGTVIAVGPNKFCRFNNSTCPSGWLQFENWRTAGTARTCGSGGGFGGFGGCACITSVDSWQNNSNIPSCNYKLATVNSEGQVQCPLFGAVSQVCQAIITQIGCF